jgi:hypothetical protein
METKKAKGQKGQIFFASFAFFVSIDPPTLTLKGFRAGCATRRKLVSRN